MKVLITARRLRTGGKFYVRGQEADVPDKDGNRMIARGWAVKHGDDPAKAREKRRPKTPAKKKAAKKTEKGLTTVGADDT